MNKKLSNPPAHKKMETGNNAEKIKFDREKKIAKAIGMVYASLESHLLTPYFSRRKDLLEKDNLFHKKCVQEYAELIKIISELY